MIRRTAVVALLAVLASSCAFAPGGGGNSRTVLVDWSHDEFASFFIANFPTKVTVEPGTTLVFRQTWTGEPHTVTGGRLADEMGSVVLPLLERWGDKPDEEIPEEVFREFEEGMKDLLWAFAEDESLNQTVAQPCYLDSGKPPSDGTACSSRTQPAEFTGRQAYYNSGIIPYEGPGGNTFEVKLSEDIDPGVYTFYCAVHGPHQRTQVEVAEQGAEVSSPEEINRAAREQIQEWGDPLSKAFQRAKEQNRATVEGRELDGPFAGLTDDEVLEAAINEFIPRTMTVEAGEPITWKLLGADHSISFEVPEYFPIVEFLDDGTVRLNPKLDGAAGGAPDPGPLEDAHRQRSEEGGSQPLRIDGGTYDGTGFWSSGLIGVQPWAEYTVRISRPGTYKYACLIHPPMVGTIEVKPS